MTKVFVEQPLALPRSVKYLHSQTGRARKLKFIENVHPPPCVKYHMSRITYHMSRAMCHMSHVIYFLIYFWTKLWSYSVEVLVSTRPTLCIFIRLLAKC